MVNFLDNCTICPNNCNVNRNKKNTGKCMADNNVKIALSSLHFFEEPCISGTNGSGTIFFSHCNLNCIYCQNYKISQDNKGKIISVKELANIMINLQNKNAHNINLVTPTIYAYQIIEAIKIAKENGLKIPIIYNTNSYENIDTIKALNRYIDVYLPDLKYYDNNLGLKYSKIKNYFDYASKSIKEMINQVGNPKFDENGIIKKGVIIRHLILPNHIINSKNILKWIKDNLGEDTYISIMAQYFPTYNAKKDQLLNRKLTNKEYKEIENYLYLLNLKNGYLQDLGSCEETYVPNFDI